MSSLETNKKIEDRGKNTTNEIKHSMGQLNNRKEQRERKKIKDLK